MQQQQHAYLGKLCMSAIWCLCGQIAEGLVPAATPFTPSAHSADDGVTLHMI